MANISFSFSGWVADATVDKVTVVETGEEIDVSDKSAAEVIARLNDGTWSISLGDHLYSGGETEINIENYDEVIP